MIVLSLFGGMECGRIALDKMGITPTKYYSSEIDKFAIAEVTANYPDVVHLGDITLWRTWNIDWWDIELVIGGSPCQGFSIAGLQLAFDDPRSKLFFIYVDVLNHVKLMRKIVYGVEPDFMLENVKMKKEWLNVITEYMGVEGVFINSSLLCAQSRQRWYWANWGITQPEDRGIMLVDILEDGWVDVDKSYCIDANYFKGTTLPQYLNKGRRQVVFRGCEISESRHYFKECCIDGEMFYYRKLTVVECCRLQGVPENYFKVSSNTQAYKMLGNGWQVNTIIHILENRDIR